MLNRNVVSLLGLYVIISLQLFTLPSLNAQEKIHGKLVKTGLWEGRQVEFLQGEIAIILRSGVSNKDISPLLEGLGATIRRDFDELGFGVIELPADVDILSVASDLKENELIKVAEPNMVVRAHWEPDDDYYQDGYQWALKNTSQSPPNGTYDADIDAQEAWDISRGNSTVIIAILDSGIPILSGNLSHTDLNLSTKFILGPDYIDDPSDGVKDMHGHGTHVTGIASAETDNSAGIAGVAGNCRVMVIQVFNQNLGGSWEAFLDGVRYAVDNGAKIINYSGGQTSPSGLAEEAVQYANDPDNYALIIASSGNDNDPLEWPAAYSSSYSNVIAVGATQHHDQKASYSNHGSGLNVVAPGGYGGSPSSNDIYSTTPNYIVEINYDDVSQLYGYLAGTSMAAPHVSGVAALILSINPSLTPSEVRQIIEESADKVPGMNGENFTNEYGYGRVNAYKALLGTNGFTFVSGIIESSVTWSGGVYVTGDVFVNPGVTLTVDPGTEILFDARRDDQHSGNETEKCELIVDGTLVVNGTQSQQVKFRSSTASSPSRWDWASITFRNGATASISNARISDTQYGIVANYASSIDIDNVEIYNVTGKCIELIECDNASITNSEVYDATKYGGEEGRKSALGYHGYTIWAQKNIKMMGRLAYGINDRNNKTIQFLDPKLHAYSDKEGDVLSGFMRSVIHEGLHEYPEYDDYGESWDGSTLNIWFSKIAYNAANSVYYRMNLMAPSYTLYPYQHYYYGGVWWK